MNKFLLFCATIFIATFAYGQRNYFWIEAGVKQSKFEQNILSSFNSYSQHIESPFQVEQKRNFFWSYGYGRILNKSFAAETGVAYNRYSFSYNYFSEGNGFIYPDFYSIELPFRIVFTQKIPRANINVQLSLGQTIDFIGIKTLPYAFSPAYGTYLNEKDTVYDLNYSSIKKSMFTLTQFGLGINKPIGNRLNLGLICRYNLGYKNLFNSDVTYRVNDDGHNLPGPNPSYGAVNVTSKGTYASLVITAAYKF